MNGVANAIDMTMPILYEWCCQLLNAIVISIAIEMVMAIPLAIRSDGAANAHVNAHAHPNTHRMVLLSFQTTYVSKSRLKQNMSCIV